ncbi:hypothetical protein LTR36_010565 [Oleoguttula mirabilis]|uniref:N-acetyltransferase domain-containing protein n=1 Tax=Oleoguttula mirabilis TaxID=1507867 RepID=A0AAV9JRJ2_9PEZI|nr:hypothetical protein LTR36_010565 [Oleoguttula mirabilis]
MDTAERGTSSSTPDILLQLPDGIALRNWRRSDVLSSVRHLNDEKVWNNLRNRIPHPYTEADATEWINFCQGTSHHVRSGKWTSENGSEGPAVSPSYAITINDEAVGGIGLDFKDDIYFRTAEVGYWLGAEHWGKGVMSKVTPAFVEWAWQTFDILVRLNAETAESNAVSGKVLEKAGFKYEGRRPNMACKNGEMRTTLVWGALRP